MKKMLAIVLVSVCMLNIVGCRNQEETDPKDAIKKEEVTKAEYSFYGENDVFTISAGHIYVDRISRFVGGSLELVDKDLSKNLVSYSEKYYIISNGEKHTILSNTLKDETGTDINSSGVAEITSEDLFNNIKSEDFVDNLWYEIKTVSEDGEENTYTIRLEVISIGE